MRTERGEAEEIGRIRDGLRTLDEGLTKGDLSARRYGKARQTLLAQLGRAKIAPLLEPGEEVLREHHWTRGLEEVPVSPLKDQARVAESLYATDRRLFLWRFEDKPDPRAAALEGFEESLQALPIAQIEAVRRRLEFRWGEALAGAAIAAVSLLGWRHLAVTGWALLALGSAAVLHALLRPGRRVTVEAGGGDVRWEVLAPARKSGRDLLGFLDEKRAGRSP
jgi:hypothetical protein